MNSPKPENYHVAMKAFVRKDKKVLICKENISEKWDLPGGRIGEGELDVPLEDILKREIQEELGGEFEYKNNGPAAIFRHQRPELSVTRKPSVNILMIGFELEYVSGEIILSEEHNEFRWVTLEEAYELLPGGQKEGMDKYIKYLKNGRKQLIY